MTHTPEPWDIYEQPISGAGDAVLELIEQVQATIPIVDTLFLINAGGKCPATTGCGPTSHANAARIVSCVNGCTGLNPDAYREVVEAAESVISDAEMYGILDGNDPQGRPINSLVVSGDPLRTLRAALAKARAVS